MCALCSIAEADLLQLARWWAEATGVLSLWSMGVNQSSEGTATVAGLINLHLVPAQIGRPGAGPFSLTGTRRDSRILFLGANQRLSSRLNRFSISLSSF